MQLLSPQRIHVRAKSNLHCLSPHREKEIRRWITDAGKIFQATFNLVSLSSLSPDTIRCSAAQRHRLRCRINVIYYSVPLGRGRGASPLTNCIFLTSAILMQFKKIISELWSDEIIGWQSPMEPKLGVSGHRNLLFQPFFRGTQYLGRKFSLFASENTQYRRMRIYLKLHFIHFKEKIWLFKDAEHQLNVLLTFSWLCGQKSLPNEPEVTSSRKTLLPCTGRWGWNLCPEAGCAKGQRETRKIPVSILHTLSWASARGKTSVRGTNEWWRAQTLATHIPQVRAHLPAKSILPGTAIPPRTAPPPGTRNWGRFS